ncbi:MAG TPA: HAD-IC family P-type ATPase, partial [Patescibacteria group bacterium]|nr:HAD-IC family P-type ATPase [Patescibacteria group bacterium]
EIDAAEVTIGDIVMLRLGDRVTADGRLIEVNDLEVNEASLTGESLPVLKSIDALEVGKAVPDRKNMVHKGTVVTQGTGEFVVTAVGVETEVGKIAEQIVRTPDENTPLQAVLERFSRRLGLIVVGFALAVFLFGVTVGRSSFEMFQIAVALAVAAIPEGLVVAVTAVLAIGMQRLLRRQGLVRNLLAAETLGSTTVICVDKTGTLTEGEMRLSRVVLPHRENGSAHHHYQEMIESQEKRDEQVFHLLRSALLISDATVERIDEQKGWKAFGNPTEKAILLACAELGVFKKDLEQEFPRIDNLPFNSRTKYSATLHRLNQNQNALYVMGGPEIILARCLAVQVGGQSATLDGAWRKKLEKEFESLSQSGLRMIGVGMRKVSSHSNRIEKQENQLVNQLTFLGFIAFRDPIRYHVKDAIRLCQEAGVRVMMITGDHRLTAQAIAGEVGLSVHSKNIIEGSELLEMSDEKLRERVKTATVFARTLPSDKLRIVNALKANGEIVAMTGDGVNDAPALMRADIGVALGSGTDVAKDSADLVLMDNNFSTIVRAVAEGRVIFDNIRKITLYLISDSFGQVGLIAAALLFGLPLPLTAAQILWINLVTDSLPSIALTAEGGEVEDLMKEKPRESTRPILDRKRKVLVGFISLFIALAGIILFYAVFKTTNDLAKAQTMVFALMGLTTLFLVFSVRTLRRSIVSLQTFQNAYLLLAVMVGFLLLLVPIYHPAFQRIFGTVALQADEWGLIAGIVIGAITLVEILKIVFRSRLVSSVSSVSSKVL